MQENIQFGKDWKVWLKQVEATMGDLNRLAPPLCLSAPVTVLRAPPEAYDVAWEKYHGLVERGRKLLAIYLNANDRL